MQAWAAPSTLHIAGLRVKERVYVRATHYARHRCAQNTDHLAHDSPFSAFFTEVVCILGAAPPQAATSQPQNGGGMTPSKAPTRRRHAARGLRMAQNPHRSRLKCVASPTRPGHSTGWREKTRPARPLQRLFREKTRPASVKTPILGCFERAGRTFSRFHDVTATQGELFRARGATT